ncbi:hypothetical protein JVT61DRAFT_7229 [Boletus reticuloceps]|uniref:Cep57 centrosome microtubule-binding domain-containing protein n=1 Tax=Boletus reticuloceps TaxID=495285 RepID=A0A8I2YJC0_9AGAM|nr:hypothetical protein JVT61DRAFT_7229 [Boletus reticuloceps]
MAKKSSSSSRREFSIPGDELEQHRIQLEHNLQNTDLSLHLSSVQDDDAADNGSLEYPRRGSAPDQFTAFASFDRHSREVLDFDASNIRAWSIHDDEGITPYDIRTMSTAAHHASAVTITAGLARNGRREPSISGAEYDADRPLQDIIAAHHAGSDAEDAEKSQDIPRPKLSETLQRVGFSPRRPRGSQPRASQHAMPESSLRHADPNVLRRNMTPRARKATVAFDTTATPIRRHVSQHVVVQPSVNVQQATPSTSGSRFTKMARGLAREVRQAQEEEDAAILAAAHRSVAKDALIRNTADTLGHLGHDGSASKKSNRSRVHLPDVTGLTNAVISPAKANLERYSVRGPGSREVEARLIASLNALHAKLNHLETENSIARRRVRELEYELEECKRDVVRERTRIMESQDAIDASAARLAVPSTSRAKGKERRNKDADPHASKYFEVVQEKKALEALVTTLRSHLTRVTSDLAAQQQLLEDLRRLRESDALSLGEKTQEINELRTEVERLAGEIEVLRGVVEEGLNERRQGRDAALDEQCDHLVDAPPDCSLPPVVESLVPPVRRFIDDEEVDRISVDLDERRSERASNSSAQSSYSAPLPMEESPARNNGRVESNPPFPKISSERMERLFFSAPRHNATLCRTCKGHHRHHRHHYHGNGGHRDSHEAQNDVHEDKDEGFDEGIETRPHPDHPRESARGVGRTYTIEDIIERMDKNGGTLRSGNVPPQTVLARVIGGLEDEFAHFREVYSILAEEYRSLDCATQAAKRHMVGDRLRDVIEVLEHKGHQIASLYDLLIFEDKPLEQ